MPFGFCIKCGKIYWGWALLEGHDKCDCGMILIVGRSKAEVFSRIIYNENDKIFLRPKAKEIMCKEIIPKRRLYGIQGEQEEKRRDHPDI